MYVIFCRVRKFVLFCYKISVIELVKYDFKTNLEIIVKKLVYDIDNILNQWGKMDYLINGIERISIYMQIK